jgi:hypothetical protein
MLKNIPTSDSMEQVSLRLYFTAWGHVTQVISEMIQIETEDAKLEQMEEQMEQEYLAFHGTPISPERIDKDAFVTRAQPDLQLAYTLIQQSQEIALKAKICAVSPFLLLLGSDVRTWPKDDADFTQFRTIDASDLIKVVNTVCHHGISEKFSNFYQIVRRERNIISHLGTYNNPLYPNIILDMLVDQYEELYKDRVWLRDRANFRNKTRHTFLHSALNPYYFNENMEILCELSVLFTVLNNKQYKSLFGFSKTARRYICHACCYDAMGEKYGPSKFITVARTATLIKGKQALFCHLCEKEYPIRHYQCLNDRCKSNVISDDHDWAGHCHMCGWDQKDFTDDDGAISPRQKTDHPIQYRKCRRKQSSAGGHSSPARR